MCEMVPFAVHRRRSKWPRRRRRRNWVGDLGAPLRVLHATSDRHMVGAQAWFGDDVVRGMSIQVLQCRRRATELRASVIRSLRASVVRPLRSTVAASVAGRVTDNRHQNSAETNYKAFITTLLLTGTLVVLWLPNMIFQLLSAHVNPEQSVDRFLFVL